MLPTPFYKEPGVIRSFDDVTLEEREDALTAQVKANSSFTKTDDLFFSGETYEVKLTHI